MGGRIRTQHICTYIYMYTFNQVDPTLKLAAQCAKPPCSFGGVYQPRFWEDGGAGSSIVLFENFFHTSHALGMSSGPGVYVGVGYVCPLGPVPAYVKSAVLVCVCVCVCVCAHTALTHITHSPTHMCIHVYICTGSSVSIADLETLGSKWCSLDWSFVEKTGDEGTSQVRQKSPSNRPTKEQKRPTNAGHLLRRLAARARLRHVLVGLFCSLVGLFLGLF
jgi:hypothetical protein